MSVTITAVPAVGAEPAGPPTNTVRDLQDFAASVRSSPMAGLPQAANPVSLASELVGGLKGYFDRAQAYQQSLSRPHRAPGDGVNVASLSDPANLASDLAGGAGDAGGAEATDGGGSWKVGLAELERAQDLAFQAQLFISEQTVVVHAVSSIPHSINTLVKGQ
jgi:hypothetical protein